MERRQLMKGAMLMGCSAAASPLMTPMAFADVSSENRLVIIILRGAMDGLDVVQPYGDRMMSSLRRGYKFGPNNGDIPLDNLFSMNRALKPLLPLLNAGQLAFAHAVSTPYRNKRSHFDGQDLLEAGTGPRLPLPHNQSGWLNRLISAFPRITSETAYAIGAENEIILNGKAPYTTWDPKAQMPLGGSSYELLKSACGRDTLFLNALKQSHDIYKDLSGGIYQDGMPKGQSPSVMDAHLAADRLKKQARIACFSIGGWDSHNNQSWMLPEALKNLADAIITLHKNLGPLWSRTTVMAMTEFGRTARINGSGGTDHGTGGAMIMAGGTLLKKKVYGTWPGLTNLYQDRDLMPTEDIRRYPAWAMRKLYGIPVSTIENVIFPGLRMGSDPGFIA